MSELVVLRLRLRCPSCDSLTLEARPPGEVVCTNMACKQPLVWKSIAELKRKAHVGDAIEQLIGSYSGGDDV